MAHDPVETWKTMKIKVWPEDYFLIDIAHDQVDQALDCIRHSSSRFCSVTRDKFGFSLVVDGETWGRFGNPGIERTKFGPLKVISTDSELPFDVPGFIRTAITPINAKGLKAAPICGLQSDHFFTGAGEIDQVLEIFYAFSAGQREHA